MFPATVAVFKSGHDPSAPQTHPERKEHAPLGMTAEEKEREAGLEAKRKRRAQPGMAVPQGQMRAGLDGGVASGWSAMFPTTVVVFKSSHDPSAPQTHPERKEHAPLGMTAEEKEREAGLEAKRKRRAQPGMAVPQGRDAGGRRKSGGEWLERDVSGDRGGV